MRVLAALVLLAALWGRGATVDEAPTPFSRASSKQEALAALEAALAGGPGGAKTGTDAPRALFRRWQRYYGVSFSQEQEETRYRVWQDNLDAILAELRDPTVSHWGGLGPFTALTWEEFKAERVSSPLGLSGLAEQGARLAAAAGPAPGQPRVTPAPPAVDWRARGQVPPIRDQGKCGCCWAQAGIGAIECATLVQTGAPYSAYKIDLSEQHVIDCANSRNPTTKFNSNGCNGGLEWEAMMFAAQEGLVSEAAYPYTSGATGKHGACQRERVLDQDPSTVLKLSGAGGDKALAPQGLGGFFTVPPLSAGAMREAVAAQPVAFAINVAESFQHYRGGVYPGEDCWTDVWYLDHALVLVGYNSTGDEPYWIVRNSWNESWGEGGYARMFMEDDGDGTCGMYQVGVTPAPVERVPELTNHAVIPDTDPPKRTYFQSGGLPGGAHPASDAADGQAGSWAQTTRGRNPWWAADLGRREAVKAVTITVRKDAGFKPASLHDLAVWVGDARPSAAADPSPALTRCASKPGKLAAKKGRSVTLDCKPGPVSGQYVVVQIRTTGWRRSRGRQQDALSLAEVKITLK